MMVFFFKRKTIAVLNMLCILVICKLMNKLFRRTAK